MSDGSKSDRLILTVLFLISFVVAVLSLVQMENGYAALVLGGIGIVYIVVRVLVIKSK